MSSDLRCYKIFIIAGEESGDILGAKLLKQLKLMHPQLTVRAIGGANLEREGAELFFHYKRIAVMGFVEIIPKLLPLLRAIGSTVDEIERFMPDMVITIDSSGFNFRVVSRLRKRIGNQIKFVHYVAPAVWAYKRERALLVKKLYDHQLLLLPFESKYFDEVGMASTYVGHPIIEDVGGGGVALDFDSTSVPLLVMPGSRGQELWYMAKTFKQAILLLEEEYGIKTTVMIPTVPSMHRKVCEIFGDLPRLIVGRTSEEKYNFFKTAHVALVKSGTSALEVAVHGIPCVVGYKMNPLNYLYLKHKVYVRFISLVNILLDKQVIPELLQSECAARNLADKIMGIISGPAREDMLKDYRKAMEMLQNAEHIAPSVKAAQTVLEILRVCTQE